MHDIEASPINSPGQARVRPDWRTRLRLNTTFHAWAVTGIFFLVALFGIIHHEMWRDEHQAWLVARDAHSLAQLFTNLKYEGNPALWHLCLFVLTRFTVNPVYMQALHLLIACAFIFVLNRYCSLSPLKKLLFSFGYFSLYEYAVISRGYGLGLLLTFIACALYQKRFESPIIFFLTLGLLANVTLYGLIISVGLAFAILLDWFSREGARRLSPRLLAGAGIYAVMAVAALCQIMPSPDNTFPVPKPESWFDIERWLYVFSKLFTTCFYMPDLRGLHFWNSNIFFSDPGTVTNSEVGQWIDAHPLLILVFLIFPVAIFLLTAASFLGKPPILALYLSVTGALLAAYYYTLLVQIRYCGHLFIILVVCCWLSKHHSDRLFRNKRLRALVRRAQRLQMPVLTLMLVLQVLGALIAYEKDYRFPFSTSKQAVKYIKENHLESLQIAGMTDLALSPLCSYLNRKIFYFQTMDFGSFVRWNRTRRTYLDNNELLQAICYPFRSGRTNLLVIMSDPIRISKDGNTFVPIEHLLLADDIKMDLLSAVESGIVDEKYYIYLAQKTDPLRDDLKGYLRVSLQ